MSAEPETSRHVVEIIAHVMLWANGRTYDTPEDAALALLNRLDHEGYRIVLKEAH